MAKRMFKIETECMRKSVEEIFKSFVMVKRAEGIAESTINLYFKEYNQFIKYYEDTKDIEKAIIDFFSFKAKQAPTTYNISYKVLNCMFNFAVLQEYIDVNPIKKVGLKPKRDEGKVRSVPDDKLKKFMKVLDLTEYVEYRDYVIILLMLDTGIRPSESFSLTDDNMDFDENIITISKEYEKTRNKRYLPISNITKYAILKLMAVKPMEWSNRHIFLSNTGGTLNVGLLARRFRIYSERSGIKITPYDLRHSYATKYLENEGNVFILQKVMGHAKLDMTKRYISISNKLIKEDHQKASPLNNIIERSTKMTKLFR